MFTANVVTVIKKPRKFMATVVTIDTNKHRMFSMTVVTIITKA